MPVIRDVMPAFELFQPTSIADTVGLLQRHDNTWLMAGGLDSFDWWKDRIKEPAVVIDLGTGAHEEPFGARGIECQCAKRSR